jgi:hypothetical protein
MPGFYFAPPTSIRRKNTMTPRSAAKRQPERVQPEASLDPVLLPPSKVEPEKLDAYWLNLANNPDEFAAAVQTEDDFFRLIHTLPASLWGDKLRLYLYRKPSDDGIMVNNSDDAPYNYAQVVYKPVDEQWVSDHWGGGKYQLWLKYVDKEKKISETIKKHTFPIDGPPKVKPGQVVLVDGKPVPVGGAPSAATPSVDQNSRSDIATIIESNTAAQEATIRMMGTATEKAMAIVESAASKNGTASAASDTSTAKLVEILLAKVLNEDPVEKLLKLLPLLQPKTQSNPEPPEPKDPPLVEAMDLVEKMSGRSFADILKGGKAAAPEQYGWVAPLANVAQQIVAQLPTIMEQARIAREMEFRRQVWLRTAPPTAQVPQDLLPAAPTAAPQPAATRERQPAQPFTPPANGQPVEVQPAPPDPMQLVGAIVNEICSWFDRRHAQGYQCAAMIDGLHGEHIEALGLEALLVDEEQVKQLIAGNPLLAARSGDKRWPDFEHDFIAYMQDRWGEDDGEDDAPANGAPKAITTQTGPQPAA